MLRPYLLKLVVNTPKGTTEEPPKPFFVMATCPRAALQKHAQDLAPRERYSAIFKVISLHSGEQPDYCPSKNYWVGLKRSVETVELAIE